MNLIITILHSWQQGFFWLCGFFVVFTLLAKFTPCNPGQSWRRGDVLVDLGYYFIMPVLSRFVHILIMAFGMYMLFRQTGESLDAYVKDGFGPLSRLPVWLQAAVIVLISDILLYWTHRWFHSADMWRFHAVHHSSEQVDWLSTFRFHPINIWLSYTLVDALMLFIGFSPAAVVAMGTANTIYSVMVHANLNWTFGPFRYLFASPVFHRWHHTAQEEGRDKNFAPTFPLLDVVFGTFYMPEGRVPEHYGVPGSGMPMSFAGQIVWPFKREKKIYP